MGEVISLEDFIYRDYYESCGELNKARKKYFTALRRAISESKETQEFLKNNLFASIDTELNNRLSKDYGIKKPNKWLRRLLYWNVWIKGYFNGRRVAKVKKNFEEQQGNDIINLPSMKPDFLEKTALTIVERIDKYLRNYTRIHRSTAESLVYSRLSRTVPF